MMKNDRRGKRQRREERKGIRPQLGYYLVVTDTKETEENYLLGLRDSIPPEFRNRLVIKVEKAMTSNLVSRCKELLSDDPQYRCPWIVFDRDQVKNFDEIIKEAEDNCICVGWSNPCIEIWFHAYFESMPTDMLSTKSCESFERTFELRTKQKYVKSDKDIYAKLCKYGDESSAILLASRKLHEQRDLKYARPSEMCPSTTMFKLVSEITNKIQNANEVT